MLHICTEILRSSTLLAQYNYKQFIERLYGWYVCLFEHIAEMSHIINHLRKQQRSVTITLIDLENAFGEVQHSLIQSVLGYHHTLDEINCIVKLLHSDFRLSIITNDFCTKYIVVEKGVLLGDSDSPLIFNLIINNLMQYVEEEKLTNFGDPTFRDFFARN